MPTIARLLLPLSLSLVSPALAQSHPPHAWTVHDIFYAEKAVPAAPAETQWSPDGTLLSYRTPDGALSAVDGQTGKHRVLTPAARLEHIAARPVDEKNRDHRDRYSQKGYFWSPDGSQVLFDEDGTLWLDTLKTGAVNRIGDTGEGSGDDVKFSPDGKHISYVHHHNLYVQTGASAPLPLTATTDPNLLNGEVDWVYLEELKVRTNYSWSPDSQRLAYVQMDETKVPTYALTDWIPTHTTVDEQKYPQAGDPNPAVRLGIVAATGGPTRWIDLPSVRPNQDYIPRSGWLDAHTVWIETLNRDHKHLDVYFADADTGKSRRVLALTDPKFFTENYDLHFYPDAPGTAMTHMLLRSWQSGHMHIDQYSFPLPSASRGSAMHYDRQLEDGPYEVIDILSIVPGEKADHGSQVYYLSNEGNALNQQLWAVGLDGSGKHQVSQGDGVHKIEFADGNPAWTDSRSTLTTPPQLALCTAGTACKPIWHDSVLAGHTLRTPEILNLKAADGHTTLYATLLLPPGKTDPASVPLITNPYGGPGSQDVRNGWSERGTYFDQLLAEHGFAVLHVDNRGMANRGRAFEQAAYRDFGKVQLSDQLAALDQVLQKYPQLDSKRLGWWGWSWGGTFTLTALTHSDRFRAGISVAPVTDFLDYDSIYTERYLGIPQAEPAVYKAAAVQPTAARLHGHLLIAHGTGDDNVHLENTIQFIQKLIDADQPYDLQLFPRKTHSIAGKEARTALYGRMLTHWEQYLLPPVQPSGR